MATAFGIKISPPELRAYVSYKYEYHRYVTLRGCYVARYLSGTPKPAGEATEMKWMPKAEAIELTPVESMKMVMEQVLSAPDTLWGGSFVVYKVGHQAHTRLVEDFYPLFTGE
ncbi:MAG: NUDIX hydrolase [Lewinella sp.]